MRLSAATDKGVKPPDNLLALDSLNPVIRLTLVTMLTKEICVRRAVTITR